MLAPVFEPYPKTPRLFRDIVVTEKIDGTNGGIIVRSYEDVLAGSFAGIGRRVADVESAEGRFYVFAQSRKRLLEPGKSTDNFGFAAWVAEHARDLVFLLGPGRHFGEWYGAGIQRGYGLGSKRFALFNPDRGAAPLDIVPGLETVPVLYRGAMDTEAISTALVRLRDWGSKAAEGFMNPEGVVVYHSAARQVFKVLLENDESPKGEAA